MAQTKRKVHDKSAATVAVAAPPRKAQPEKWQLQTAKAKFSEVFRRARTEGPQHVVKHGSEEVVIVSKEEFERMAQPPETAKSLAQVLLESPFAGSGIQFERSREYPRKIVL